jgi:histidinol-phosphate aminotransferase
MSQYWSALVHDLDPYVPGEQPKDQRYIKLNTNECPYPPSPAALLAMQAQVNEQLRLYPDPNGDVLKDAVADYYGVTRAQVFVGNGSDEVLAHVFHGLLKHAQPLLFPDIGGGFQLRFKRLPHEKWRHYFPQPECPNGYGAWLSRN